MQDRSARVSGSRSAARARNGVRCGSISEIRVVQVLCRLSAPDFERVRPASGSQTPVGCTNARICGSPSARPGWVATRPWPRFTGWYKSQPAGGHTRYLIRPGRHRPRLTACPSTGGAAPRRARVLHLLTQSVPRIRGLCIHVCFFVVSAPMLAIFPYRAPPPHSATLR